MKLIFTSINLLFLILFCGNPSATETIETENKDAETYVKIFDKRLQSLTLERDTVHFLFKKVGLSFISDDEEGSGFDFKLKQGQTFRSAPGDHESSKYKLLEVGAEDITIQYESEFDHRSFGPDEITIDRGTFKLPYISPTKVNK
jgi:hypothetical protein